MGAGALSMMIDDFDGDNFDHSGLGFIGGGLDRRSERRSAPPIDFNPVPAGTPRWGSEWKEAGVALLQPLLSASPPRRLPELPRATISTSTRPIATPTGLPLLRMTFDFRPNEYKMSDYITKKAAEIAKAAGARAR